LYLRLEQFITLLNVFSTGIAPDFVSGLVLVLAYCSALNSDGKFGDFYFLFSLCGSGGDPKVDWVVVCVLMGSDMCAAEAIEAFQAYEESIGVGLYGHSGTG
jgi:hypothetical protein